MKASVLHKVCFYDKIEIFVVHWSYLESRTDVT